jgi:Catalase
VLDRCINDFLAETEQVAFRPSNIVPNVDFSNDPFVTGAKFLLFGRMATKYEQYESRVIPRIIASRQSWSSWLRALERP